MSRGAHREVRREAIGRRVPPPADLRFGAREGDAIG